jgi:hypothetical protein
MKQLYGIDMKQTQYGKTYEKIPAPDIAISMGGDIGCPFIDRVFDNNWGLPELECFVTKALIPCGLSVCKGF